MYIHKATYVQILFFERKDVNWVAFLLGRFFLRIVMTSCCIHTLRVWVKIHSTYLEVGDCYRLQAIKSEYIEDSEHSEGWFNFLIFWEKNVDIKIYLQLTQWSRVLLGNLTVAQFVKKLSAFLH
jgi:hypothetical protein